MTRSKQRFAAVAFTFEAGLGLVAILIGRGMGVDPLPLMRLSQPTAEFATSALWGIAAALPLLLGLVILDRQPNLLADFKQRVTTIVLPMFTGLSVVEIAAISAAAGFGEEMLFRGLVQGGLQTWLDQPLGSEIAIAIAAVAFGLCHWLNATYAVLATGVGIYFGVLFVMTGDLIPPMIAHGLYDFVAILYLTRMPGRPKTPAENLPERKLP